MQRWRGFVSAGWISNIVLLHLLSIRLCNHSCVLNYQNCISYSLVWETTGICFSSWLRYENKLNTNILAPNRNSLEFSRCYLFLCYHYYFELIFACYYCSVHIWAWNFFVSYSFWNIFFLELLLECEIVTATIVVWANCNFCFHFYILFHLLTINFYWIVIPLAVDKVSDVCTGLMFLSLRFLIFSRHSFALVTSDYFISLLDVSHVDEDNSYYFYCFATLFCYSPSSVCQFVGFVFVFLFWSIRLFHSVMQLTGLVAIFTANSFINCSRTSFQHTARRIDCDQSCQYFFVAFADRLCNYFEQNICR